MPVPTEASPYDEIDYPGHAFPNTHPARVAAVGILRGMNPGPIEHCRVLEVGCGDGANLIPMAYELPHARFLGIDLAARPIARGRERIGRLGLSNVELEAMDLMDVEEDMGQFDFIIAHGLYSWVSEVVRHRVLEICARHLASTGIAFVSYLAEPGNQIRDVLRQLLLRFSDHTADVGARVRRARQLMGIFAAAPVGGPAFHELARSFAQEFEKLDDGVIYHDWLAPENAAMYVTGFVDVASRLGLAFLGEAEYFMMRYEHDPLLAAAREELVRLEEQDIVMKEQLLDFLRGRRFRQTLLCHGNVLLSRPEARRVFGLAASSQLALVDEPNLSTSELAEFRSPRGNSLRIDHPVVKTVLARLGGEWPRAIPFAELLTGAREAAGRTDAGSGQGDADVLGAVLLACYGASYAEFFAHAPRFTLTAGERPRASAVARDEIDRTPLVTNLRHENLRIDDALGAALLRLLDGTRDRRQIVDSLTEMVASGSVPSPKVQGGDVREAIASQLDDSLKGLAHSALLEA